MSHHYLLQIQQTLECLVPLSTSLPPSLLDCFLCFPQVARSPLLHEQHHPKLDLQSHTTLKRHLSQPLKSIEQACSNAQLSYQSISNKQSKPKPLKNQREVNRTNRHKGSSKSKMEDNVNAVKRLEVSGHYQGS
jgi:hypothetical protein